MARTSYDQISALITQLKTDLDRRLDDIADRLLKMEVSYNEAGKKIVRIETQFEGITKRIESHEAADKEYGRDLHTRITAIEKAQADDEKKGAEMNTKVYIVFSVLMAVIASGIGIVFKYIFR